MTWRLRHDFQNGGHLGSATLDCLIFPKPSKATKIDQKSTVITLAKKNQEKRGNPKKGLKT